MYRNFIFFLLFISSSFLATAQKFGEMEWQKKKIPAVVIEVAQPASITEDAILKKITQLGYNAKETKGAYVYKGIRIKEIGNETFDIIIKVERKSRRDKDESVVYLAVSRGYENYITPKDDGSISNNMKDYSLNFRPWAEAEGLEREIADQEEKVTGLTKKLQDITDECETLMKKKQKLEQDIQTNKLATEKQAAEVEIQKKALEILRAKRKS